VGHDWSRLTDDDSRAYQSTTADRAAETKLTGTGSTAEPSHGAGLELAECLVAGGGCTPRALPTGTGPMMSSEVRGRPPRWVLLAAALVVDVQRAVDGQWIRGIGGGCRGWRDYQSEGPPKTAQR
jgi:hypothetical protein